MFPAAPIVSSDSLGGTATLIQEGVLCLVAVRAINTTAADAYVQLFDAAAAADVTLGTTVPLWVVQSDANDPSVGDGLPTNGTILRNGLVAASTTTSTGNTAAVQHVKFVII